MFQSHKYGSQVKLLEDLFLNSALTKLCSPATIQPQANQLIELLYTGLLRTVVSDGFSVQNVKVKTRMTEIYKNHFYQGAVLAESDPIVIANLARAGTIPSYVIFQLLNQIYVPQKIRQDHIMATRKTDSSGRVVGTDFGAAKIGCSIDSALVLFPDPMGATGGTISAAIDHYTKNVSGTAKKFIAIHLIVTPEYLRKMAPYKNLTIYALRVDRGFSSEKALNAVPGTYWDEEVGLDKNDYIVPGAGGLGEIMNNCFEQ